MLSSISPVGESARGQRWRLTATAYVLGLVGGGALMGALTGSIGSLLVGQASSTVRLNVLGVTAALGLAVDLTIGVPSVYRQVDRRWLDTYRGWVYGLGFGLQLGVGVATVVPASLGYLVWVGTALIADPIQGAAVGVIFGLARSAFYVELASRATTAEGLRNTMARMSRRQAPVGALARIGQGLVVMIAITAGML